MTDADRPTYADLGPLAAALAKAQASFPPIVRDKEVDTRTYKYKYAPLDSIIAAVRGPLAANGLAITQLLDGSDLVTMLLHESGASLAGRVGISSEGTIQQFGSAVTYIRRYALQAILGIAAEEDDDGDAAEVRAPRAQDARIRSAAVEQVQPDGGLVGVAEKGQAVDSDFELRRTPTGARLGFRLTDKGHGIKAVALDALAELIAEHRADIEGQRVTGYGAISDQSFTPRATANNPTPKKVTYQQLDLVRLRAGALDLSAPESGEITEGEMDAIFPREAVGA